MKLPILYLIAKVGLRFPYSSCWQGPATDTADGRGSPWAAEAGQGEQRATRAGQSLSAFFVSYHKDSGLANTE